MLRMPEGQQNWSNVVMRKFLLAALAAIATLAGAPAYALNPQPLPPRIHTPTVSAAYSHGRIDPYKN